MHIFKKIQIIIKSLNISIDLNYQKLRSRFLHPGFIFVIHIVPLTSGSNISKSTCRSVYVCGDMCAVQLLCAISEVPTRRTDTDRHAPKGGRGARISKSPKLGRAPISSPSPPLLPLLAILVLQLGRNLPHLACSASPVSLRSL